MKINIYSLEDVEPGDEVTVKYLGGTWTGPVGECDVGSGQHLCVMNGGCVLRYSDGSPSVYVEFLVATRELPDWPTAKHVWWDGEVWTDVGPEEPRYESSTRAVYRGCAGAGSYFAREAVPVKLFNALTGAVVGE